MQRSAIIGLTLFAALAVPIAPAAALNQVVATYHYDNLRTGWNRKETTLTPANVGQHIVWRARPGRARRSSRCATPSSFQATDYRRSRSCAVARLGRPPDPYGATYQVVYVATEGNTVYAIRASDGTVLLSRNLGTPVSMPLTCTNNGPNVRNQ